MNEVKPVSRVFIVGSGVVGAATGRGLLQFGHQVTFVDRAADRLTALTAEGLDARPSLDLDGEAAAFVVLCLPSHLAVDRYELGAVENGAAEVGLALADADADARHTLVVRSAVPPGSTEHLIRPLLESCTAKRQGEAFDLAAAPDTLTLRPGRPRTSVIGARSQAVAHRVRDLLLPLGMPGEEVRLFDDPATAELIKCTDNLFSTAKISFWQEIWEVCCMLGLNPDRVASAVAESAKATFLPIYGPHDDWQGGQGRAGGQGRVDRTARPPRDPRGFLAFAADLGLPASLLSAVVGLRAGPGTRRPAVADDSAEHSASGGCAPVRVVPRPRAEPERVGAALTQSRIPRQQRLSGGA